LSAGEKSARPRAAIAPFRGRADGGLMSTA